MVAWQHPRQEKSPIRHALGKENRKYEVVKAQNCLRLTAQIVEFRVERNGESEHRVLWRMRLWSPLWAIG
ncbi:Uncharacterized protein APZ42_011065 [Daphnia magna]|uniref:Uncharacterized protein n=1 Tax=Daphnia magna TaxID=35525 RepID=A0A162T6X1_9CRUS|nr:Uncharacterized protein APZ42_011065 [Daphnia magna]